MKKLLATRYSLLVRRRSAGIASLPVVLLLGGIILEIGIAGTFLLSYLNSGVYGNRLAGQALIAAESGISDAVLRVILNKNCGADANCSGDPYDFITESGSAEVTICKDLCIPNKHQITSVGRALTKRRQLIAVLTVSSSTGLVSVDSITDTPQ